MTRYVRRTRLPVTREEAFAWHERPGAFQRLTPPFMPARLERGGGTLEAGSEVVLRLLPRAGQLGPRWRARHVVYDPPAEFRDEQVSGPFAEWSHRHRFDPADAGSTVLTDDVDYRLPLGALGAAVAGPAVHRQLDRMFAYRHRVAVADLAAHARAARKGVGTMHVAITGASGLIGEALSALLTTGGHRVTRLVRREPGEGELGWDPERGEIDADGLRGVDAVVHLAGESIASVRWTEGRKRRVMESRRKGTRLIAETLAGLDGGPSVLVSASGIDYYGDTGDEAVTEESPPGRGFLADVCREWEAATAAAADAGVRVVTVRTGVVQSPQGGALAKQLPLFRAGIGGRIGSGRQWLSWISLDDVAGVYHHALTSPEISGPLNATAPEPVTNAEHAKTVGRVLRRPTPLPVPSLGPRLVLRDMADDLLLGSKRVLPARALETGYVFRHPTLEGCLRDALGRPAPSSSG